MSLASPRFLALARAPASELQRLIESRPGPSLESLAGFEWRGYNTPAVAALLGIRKFIKGFFRSGRGLEGYNIPARQNGLAGPWLHKPSPERPKRFGFYRVGPARDSERDRLYPAALLLDYGASSRNPRLAVERLLRDYLVQPDPGNPDLLLGKAYLALGARLPASYFILERLRPSPWAP